MKEAPRIFVGLESDDIVFIKFAFAFFIRVAVLVFWERLRERMEAGGFHPAEPG